MAEVREAIINGALFRRIANNDPTLTKLNIWIVPIEPSWNDFDEPTQVAPSTDEEWAKFCKVIGQNRHIKKVAIQNMPPTNRRSFFLNAFAKFVEWNPNLEELQTRVFGNLGEVGMRIIVRALNRREVRSIKKVRIYCEHLH